MTPDEALELLVAARSLLNEAIAGLETERLIVDEDEPLAPLMDGEWDKYAAVLEITPEPVVPVMALVPDLAPGPTSSTEHTLSVAESLGERLAKAGKPRQDVLELMQGFPDEEIAAAVYAWVRAIPERRRFEGDIWQVDHVRDDGQVFTVKVHANGVVTGLRADFPADVWRSAELVEA